MFKKTENGVVKVTTTETESIVNSDSIKSRIERYEERIKDLKADLKEVEKMEKENKWESKK